MSVCLPLAMVFHPQWDLPGSYLHCKFFTQKSSNITATCGLWQDPFGWIPSSGCNYNGQSMRRSNHEARRKAKQREVVVLLVLGLSFKGPLTSQHRFPAGQVLTFLRTLGRVLNCIQTTFESPTVMFYCLQLDPLHNSSGQWTCPVTRSCRALHGWTWATNLPCLWGC